MAVVLPAANGRGVEWLTHLGRARSADWSAILMKVEASVVPPETAVGEQASDGFTWLGDQCFVSDLENPLREYSLPIGHQFRVALVVEAELG